MYDDLSKKSGQEGLSSKFDLSAKPTVKVDVERYQQYLDGSDLNDAEKEEFLQALWQIIVGFVELGFGVHPTQEVCGKDAGKLSASAKRPVDGVCSSKPEDIEKHKGPKP